MHTRQTLRKLGCDIRAGVKLAIGLGPWGCCGRGAPGKLRGLVWRHETYTCTVDRVYQSRLSPRENTCPSVDSTMWVPSVVPALQAGPVLIIRHWEVTARVQKAFLSFFSICFDFFLKFLLTWREHAWVSWSVRRDRARSCDSEYVLHRDL